MILVGIVLVISASSTKVETYSSNENINRSVDLSTMALFINKEEEERAIKEAEQKKLEEEEKAKEQVQTYVWSAKDSYTGQLTGYEANCPLCTGRLACNSKLDLSGGRNTYNDATYGTVNIVASSKNLPCGTIIKFNYKKVSSEPIVAIVLDRGVGGNNIDLLVPNRSYALKVVGRSSVSYDVLRMGWEN